MSQLRAGNTTMASRGGDGGGDGGGGGGRGKQRGVKAFGNSLFRAEADPTAKRKQVGEHHDGSFGVYMAHKIQKLRHQNAALVETIQPVGGRCVGTASDGRLAGAAMNDASRSNGKGKAKTDAGIAVDRAKASLFAGVHVYVDGYTVPSKEEIRSLLLLHGGGFEHYETAWVTHIVATHLAMSKLLQIRTMKHPTPVVSPEWIVKSIEQGVLLPLQPFLYRGFADPTQVSLSLSSSFSASTASPAKPPRRERVKERGKDKLETIDGNEHISETFRHHSENIQVLLEDVPTVDTTGVVVHHEQPRNREEEASFSDLDGDSDADDDSALARELQADITRKVLSHTKPSISSRGSSLLRTNSSRDGPEFVRHYFANSRLHHIGSWRTTFQQRAVEFQAKYKGEGFSRATPTSNDRVILHVDMDCFFVAVAVRDRPEFEGLPVAIAHSESAGSSEISSCNYLARDRGVHAGMFMQSAKDLCPELVVLPYKFDEIQEVSFQIYDIFFSRTPFVQAMSCDEAYLEFGKDTNGVTMAETIREEIFSTTRCVASVGISYNILLAKLATREAKPDGLFQIATPKEAEPFITSLKIEDLPGVGRRMKMKMEELGLEDMFQLRSFSKVKLQDAFGSSTGEMLHQYARGIDSRSISLEANTMRKSVSAVINFGIRFQTRQDSTEFLMALAEELSIRLKNLQVRSKNLTLLIKKRREGAPVEPAKFMGCGACDSFSRTHILAEPTDSETIIGATCIELLRQLNFPSEELRGVGIQATKLVSLQKPAETRSGQLFRAWLSETGSSSSSAANVIHTETPAPSDLQNFDSYPDSLSQVSTTVLDELPSSIRAEIVASYKRQPIPSGSSNTHQPRAVNDIFRQPPLHGKGKKKLVQKPPRAPARVVYERQASISSGQPDQVNALNDVPMSQIDEEVYHALPIAIQKEIDKHAKKRKNNDSIGPPRRTLNSSSVDSITSTVVAVMQVNQLQSIEELFQDMVRTMKDREMFVTDSSTHLNVDHAYFDSIYTRILIELEHRTLDNALRMLRYVRRKCQQHLNHLPQELLRSGFNCVLDQVNNELRQQYRAVFSSKLLAPL